MVILTGRCLRLAVSSRLFSSPRGASATVVAWIYMFPPWLWPPSPPATRSSRPTVIEVGAPSHRRLRALEVLAVRRHAMGPELGRHRRLRLEVHCLPGGQLAFGAVDL